jgi:hypothetical protein
MSRRPRTEAGVEAIKGREQLLLKNSELQIRLCTKCDEAELLPLLLAHGLIRRLRTIQVEVRPLGGDSFEVTLDASLSTVGEVKVEIARFQGTKEACQELYKVAMRSDGLAVREDDAEPELLDDESLTLGDREVVAMAVTEGPAVWLSYHEELVALREDGAVATCSNPTEEENEEQGLDIGEEDDEFTLTTSGVELTQGKHYWEIELLSVFVGNIMVGVSRPNLKPLGKYYTEDCMDGWFIEPQEGRLFGNEKEGDVHGGLGDQAGFGAYKQGDRIGVLLDLDEGSLRFFRNGVPDGRGFEAGSVTAPVVHAVNMLSGGSSVRLLPNAVLPKPTATNII